MSKWSQSNTQKTSFNIGENRVLYTQYTHFISDVIAAHNDDIDTLTAEIGELKKRMYKYEAREQADNETLHEFAAYLSEKRIESARC